MIKRYIKRRSGILLMILFVQSCLFSSAQPVQTKPGASSTELYMGLLKGKNIGIVANQTSVIGSVSLIDTLVKSGITIKKIFCPEHGFRGTADAGASINNEVDKLTGLPVISLYGKHLKPTTQDLAGLDIVVYDLQDVGVRFYTYISTLTYVMEACALNKVQLLILDRPNPNGFYVDGPVLKPSFASFVGLHPIPIVYGMTPGEYARMVNGEGWLPNHIKCMLQVIPLKNWDHNTRYVLPVKPSPNLPDMDAIYIYPTACLFEGTIMSVGRGTEKPFRYIGHPDWPNRNFSFKPLAMKGASLTPPFKDILCYGFDLSGVGNYISTSKTPQLSLSTLFSAYKQLGKKSSFFIGFFDKLAGTDSLRLQIEHGKTEVEIRSSWKNDILQFKKIRRKYLLYKDFEKSSSWYLYDN
jgi:uncharacterized protein YbbC (DUF1343 family)